MKHRHHHNNQFVRDLHKVTSSLLPGKRNKQRAWRHILEMESQDILEVDSQGSYKTSLCITGQWTVFAAGTVLSFGQSFLLGQSLLKTVLTSGQLLLAGPCSSPSTFVTRARGCVRREQRLVRLCRGGGSYHVCADFSRHLL